MQFKQNVGVFTANGREAGHVDRVVVDPQTKTVTHIVVRKGFLFKGENRVVPVNLIADTTEDWIELRDSAEDLQALPPFEEKHYVPLEGETPRTSLPSGLAPPLYDDYAASPGQRLITQIEQNIPEGTVAMKEGAKVVTVEGKHVGNVECVITDTRTHTDRATHLLISQGLFLKERKLIPMAWVNIIGEEEVHLSVDQKTLETMSLHPN